MKLLIAFLAILLPGCEFAAAAGLDRYARLDPPRAEDRILIVAPHIDDEALAAGGYTADAIAAGAGVFVVYLTAGDHSRTAIAMNRLTFYATARLSHKAGTRLAEARRAAARMGIHPSHLILLGYPDRGLGRMIQQPERTIRSPSTGKTSVPYPQALSPDAPYRMENLLSDLQTVLSIVQPDVVIAPIEYDRHPDHRAAAILTQLALSKMDSEATRLGYFVHSWRTWTTPFRRSTPGPPRHLVLDDWVIYPLSEQTLSTKRAVLREYRSQRRSPYLRMVFQGFSRRVELFLRQEGLAPDLPE